MRSTLALVFAIGLGVLTFGAVIGPAIGQTSSGALVLVGGGGTTDEILARTLELAGGENAIVAVLPQSSALADAGDSSVEMWLSAGAREAAKVSFEPPAAARRALDRATLIWMPGGNQNRFMEAIAGTGLDEVIRARHQAGAVVGGTSAGAAVISAAMITGEADLESITAGATVLGQGLGLLPDVIVDQHFLRRQRGNRLISAVLDRPSLVGVGIDERTAVVVRGDVFEVVGESSVVIVDAREATVRAEPGQPSTGTGLKMAVLTKGMTWRR